VGRLRQTSPPAGRTGKQFCRHTFTRALRKRSRSVRTRLAGALQYRHDQGLPEGAMAVLIQKQVGRLFRSCFQPRSINQHDNAVVIERCREILRGCFRKEITPGPVSRFCLRRAISSKATELGAAGRFRTENRLGDLTTSINSAVAFLSPTPGGQYHGIHSGYQWSY